jgi:adenine deaminase
VAHLGGGVAVAEDGAVQWSVPLHINGMSSAGGFADAVAIERELAERAARGGYPFHDILYTLLFSVCDFLPDIRLTPRGLIEVKTGAILEPADVNLGISGGAGEAPAPRA